MPTAPTRARTAARWTFEPYLRDITSTPPLAEDEEQDLAWRIVEDGDPEARDHMVRAHLRLVVRIAARYAGRGLPFEDLVAEGNLGLIRAAEDFDPTVGARFSAYATFWVRQSILRALTYTSRTVRLPAHMAQLLTRWRRAARELQEDLGAPGPEEVAARLGLPAKKMRAVREALRTLEGPGWEDAPPLGELPAGDDAPGARLEEEEQARRAVGLLDRLDPHYAGVLRLRFGLGGERPLTLREIGDRLGLSRERVRQVEAGALARMRAALAG